MSEVMPLEDRLPTFGNAQAVRKLLKTNGLAADEWQHEELGELLGHQLAAELAPDLGVIDPAMGLGVQQLTERIGQASVTFEQVLAGTNPAVDLLSMVKWFAKKHLVAADPALPKPIALYLYNLSIVNARRFCGQKISATPDREAMASMAWLLQQPWLIGPPKELLESALQWLSTRPPAP